MTGREALAAPLAVGARGMSEDPVVDLPRGGDVVIPEPARLGPLRLLWLRVANRGRLRVGAGVRLGRDAQVRIARGARVELGDGCYLGDGCRVEAVSGALRVGPRALIGPRAFVVSRAGLTLGAECVISDFAAVGVVDSPGEIGPVSVGERARVAAHATVASGASVAADASVTPYATARMSSRWADSPSR